MYDHGEQQGIYIHKTFGFVGSRRYCIQDVGVNSIVLFFYTVDKNREKNLEERNNLKPNATSKVVSIIW